MNGNTSDRFRSLDAALRHHHLPLENDRQIRRFVTTLGMSEFYDRGSYIKAVRPHGDRGPALQIHYGWTNGFATEDEAVMAADRLTEHWKSKRGWGVTHVENKLRSGNSSRTGGGRGSALPRDACPTCHYQLPVSGRCDNCS